MLYKKGEMLLANNLWSVDYIVADTEEEAKLLLAEGWHASPMEACVPEKERAAALAAIVKTSERAAKANIAAFLAQGLDATGTWRLDNA